MKIFYFKRNLRKIIPAACLAVMACWGMYTAYLEEPLALRTGAGVDTPIEEGVSIALKVENNNANTGEAVMKLAKELKKSRFTDVDFFFTKAWIQKYPEAYAFVVKKGFETGVWWYDKDTMYEKPVEVEYAKVYIMQTAEMMSKLAEKNICLYLESTQCAQGDLTSIAQSIPCYGVCADQKLDGLKIADKLSKVEQTAQIGLVYSDTISATTVEELEQIRDVLQSKNMEIIPISVNKKIAMQGEQNGK